MLLRRFAKRYMAPYGWWYLAGLGALLITNWISVTIPLHLANGIDAMSLGADGKGKVLTAALTVGGLGLIVIAVRTASRVLFFTPGRLVEARVKGDLFASILHHQPGFLRKWSTGDLFSRISSDVNMLRLMAGFGALQASNVIIALGMAGTQMFRLSPRLAGIVVVPLLAALVVMQIFIRKLFLLMRREQIQMAELSDFALSSYRGVATVQGFVAEDAFEERFETRNHDYLATVLKRANLRAFMGPILSLAAAINTFLLLYVGGPMTVRGEITVGELVAFIALINFATMPLRASSFLFSVFKQGQASLERVDAILYESPDRPEGDQGLPSPTAAPRIEVRDLTFAYPDADKPVLKSLNFTLEPGETLGVLGLTGAGKTTLLRLLSRLQNPPRGTIFVDGTDVLDLDLDDWRRAMTMVPQRPFLFGESLRDNILMGHEDPELRALLEACALTQDVAALPDGLQTLVGESGVRLSGGQRQRAALARGLRRRSPALFLDDVLSAVDHHTEAQLIGTLQDTTGGATTTIIVAHRVSALQHADKVLVLHEGRQQAFGAPNQLLERDGLYRDTWKHQMEER